MRFRYTNTCMEGDFFIIDSEKKLPSLFVIYSTDEIVDDWVRMLNSISEQDDDKYLISDHDLDAVVITIDELEKTVKGENDDNNR